VNQLSRAGLCMKVIILANTPRPATMRTAFPQVKGL
jgi:hypothetical protein